MGENGHSNRPFGPHGTDCTCPWSDEQTPDSEDASSSGDSTKVSLTPGMTVLDVMGVVISDALGEVIVEAQAALEIVEQPLTDLQLSRINGALMRAYHKAKTYATIIHYKLEEAQTEPAAPATEAEPEELSTDTKPKLHDIADLFWRKPDDSNS